MNNIKKDLVVGFFAKDVKEAAIGAAKELISYTGIIQYILWKNAGWVPGQIRRSPNPGNCSADIELSEQEYTTKKQKAESMIGRDKRYHLIKYNCQIFADEFIQGL